MEIFLAESFVRSLVPHAPSIPTDFNPFRPVPSSTVCPAAHGDLPFVDDDGFVDWGYDGRGDGHVLDREAVGVGGVVFAVLGSVVEIFFHFDGGCRGAGEGIDTSQPFDASGK